MGNPKLAFLTLSCSEEQCAPTTSHAQEAFSVSCQHPCLAGKRYHIHSQAFAAKGLQVAGAEKSQPPRPRGRSKEEEHATKPHFPLKVPHNTSVKYRSGYCC